MKQKNRHASSLVAISLQKRQKRSPFQQYEALHASRRPKQLTGQPTPHGRETLNCINVARRLPLQGAIAAAAAGAAHRVITRSPTTIGTGMLVEKRSRSVGRNDFRSGAHFWDLSDLLPWSSRVLPSRSSAATQVSDTNVRLVIGLIFISAIIRVLLASATGFGVDESYTVSNARHFDLSYVDYPPLHAWLVGAWARLLDTESPTLLRLPFIALFGGATWMLFRLTADLFNARAGLWAALALNVAPVFGLAHASWVLPDGPLIFFMLCATRVVAFILFSHAEPLPASRQWLAAGALAGCALLSKYHAMFLLLGVFVFLLTSARYRGVLLSPGPWIAVGVALIVFSPVIIWNLDHHFIGLSFQTDRVTTSVKPNLGRMLTGFGAQAAYLAPWVFAPLAYALIKAALNVRAAPRFRFLVLIASGPILLFAFANLTAKGLPHWPMPGWLFAFPLLGVEMAELERARPQLVRVGFGCAAIALLALAGAVGLNASTGVLTRGAPPARLARIDPTLALLNWSDVGAALSSRGLLAVDTPAVAALSWFDAGKLNYAIGRTTPVLCLCANPQEFRYLSDPARYAGRNILILSSKRDQSGAREALSAWFHAVEALPPIVVHRAGRPAIELAVFRGIALRPPATGAQTP